MGDGAGAANRRFAVAAADWKSVGGAWTPESEENRWSRPRAPWRAPNQERDRGWLTQQ